MSHRARKRISSGVKLVALASLLQASSLLAPSAACAEDRASKILHEMSDYLAGQKTIAASFDAGIEIVTRDLEKIQFNSSGEILLSRPDKLRLSRTGGYSDLELRFDGNTATLLGKKLGVFAQFPSPGSVDQLLTKMQDEYGIPMPGADLLLSDVFTALSRDVMEEKYIGTDMISGIECEHLAFRNDETDWQLWVDAGDQAIPRKLIITNKTAAGAPEYTLLFTKWQAGEQGVSENFTFPAPPSAKKMEIKEFAQMSEIDEIPPRIMEGEKQ